MFIWTCHTEIIKATASVGLQEEETIDFGKWLTLNLIGGFHSPQMTPRVWLFILLRLASLTTIKDQPPSH